MVQCSLAFEDIGYCTQQYFLSMMGDKANRQQQDEDTLAFLQQHKAKASIIIHRKD